MIHVLFFVHQKSIAKMLLDWSLVLCLSKSFFSLHSSNLCKINYRKLREDNREKRSILLETLVEVNEGNLCDTLKTTIPFGVAYHHSGLTGDGKYELIYSFDSLYYLN